MHRLRNLDITIPPVAPLAVIISALQPERPPPLIARIPPGRARPHLGMQIGLILAPRLRELHRAGLAVTKIGRADVRGIATPTAHAAVEIEIFVAAGAAVRAAGLVGCDLGAWAVGVAAVRAGVGTALAGPWAGGEDVLD